MMDRRTFVCGCGTTLVAMLCEETKSQGYIPGYTGSESGDSTTVELPKTVPTEPRVKPNFGTTGASTSSNLGGCSLLSSATGSPLSGRNVQSSSGVPLLDGMLRQETARLQNMFLVRPNVAWFDDRGAPNAFASAYPLIGPSADGSILMGIELCRRIVQRFSALREMSTWVAMTVLAHEYGHILQFAQLKRGATANHKSKYPELHADFLAGAYVAQRAIEGKMIFGANLLPSIEAAVQQFFSIGDTDFTNETHHGTGDERVQAFTGGVNLILETGRRGGSIAIGRVFQIARSAAGY